MAFLVTLAGMLYRDFLIFYCFLKISEGHAPLMPLAEPSFQNRSRTAFR